MEICTDWRFVLYPKSQREAGKEEAGTDDDTSDLPEGKLSWVECEECSVWYHFVSVGVVNNDSLGQYWVCDKCLN